MSTVEMDTCGGDNEGAGDDERGGDNEGSGDGLVWWGWMSMVGMKKAVGTTRVVGTSVVGTSMAGEMLGPPPAPQAPPGAPSGPHLVCCWRWDSWRKDFSQ